MNAPLKNAELDCWMQTYSGLVFHPLDPAPDSIEIVDIASALSKLCRFGGHCSRFYSVAEHCVHVAVAIQSTPRASRALALAALMHDASEAYLVDIPRPIKPQLTNYRAIEDNLMGHIARRFNFEWPTPEEVKVIDTRILSDERDQNMAFMDVESKLWGNVLPPLGIKLNFWQPDDAFEQFLAAFHRYGGGALC